MTHSDTKEKICLKAIAPRLMDLMREIGTATSESLATMLINKIVYENPNLNAQDTIKRRIYDVINVLSAAGIIEKVGKKITWRGIKGYGSLFAQPSAVPIKHIFPMLPPPAGMPNYPLLTSTTQTYPSFNGLPTIITPIPAGLQVSFNNQRKMTLAEKEKLLFTKIKALALYKILIQRNIRSERPENYVPIPSLIFGYDSQKKLTIIKDKKEMVVLKNAKPDTFDSTRAIVFRMKIDKSKIEQMLLKNPQYAQFTEQALSAEVPNDDFLSAL